jgi:hypothetical protein
MPRHIAIHSVSYQLAQLSHVTACIDAVALRYPSIRHIEIVNVYILPSLSSTHCLPCSCTHCAWPHWILLSSCAGITDRGLVTIRHCFRAFLLHSTQCVWLHICLSLHAQASWTPHVRHHFSCQPTGRLPLVHIAVDRMLSSPQASPTGVRSHGRGQGISRMFISPHVYLNTQASPTGVWSP